MDNGSIPSVDDNFSYSTNVTSTRFPLRIQYGNLVYLFGGMIATVFNTIIMMVFSTIRFKAKHSGYSSMALLAFVDWVQSVNCIICAVLDMEPFQYVMTERQCSMILNTFIWSLTASMFGTLIVALERLYILRHSVLIRPNYRIAICATIFFLSCAHVGLVLWLTDPNALLIVCIPPAALRPTKTAFSVTSATLFLLSIIVYFILWKNLEWAKSNLRLRSIASDSSITASRSQRNNAKSKQRVRFSDESPASSQRDANNELVARIKVARKNESKSKRGALDEIGLSEEGQKSTSRRLQIKVNGQIESGPHGNYTENRKQKKLAIPSPEKVSIFNNCSNDIGECNRALRNNISGRNPQNGEASPLACTSFAQSPVTNGLPREQLNVPAAANGRRKGPQVWRFGARAAAYPPNFDLYYNMVCDWATLGCNAPTGAIDRGQIMSNHDGPFMTDVTTWNAPYQNGLNNVQTRVMNPGSERNICEEQDCSGGDGVKQSQPLCPKEIPLNTTAGAKRQRSATSNDISDKSGSARNWLMNLLPTSFKRFNWSGNFNNNTSNNNSDRSSRSDGSKSDTSAQAGNRMAIIRSTRIVLLLMCEYIVSTFLMYVVNAVLEMVQFDPSVEFHIGFYSGYALVLNLCSNFVILYTQSVEFKLMCRPGKLLSLRTYKHSCS